MIDPILRLEKLSAGYGREWIVQGISFAVPSGQLCSVIGQNGSGKSTLLRAVCGLLPRSGRCFIVNREITEMSLRQRSVSIGYLSQESDAVKGISCLDMVLLGFYAQLGAFRKPGNAEKGKALSLMEELGVTELADRDFASVSMGQRQLVRIARTLVTEPELLIMDEADAALDLCHRKELFSVLKRRTQNGCSVLLVSHDINAVLRYSDRMLVLQNGRLTSDVLCTPDNTDELQTVLGRLYGNVEVFNHNGHLMMGDLV